MICARVQRVSGVRDKMWKRAKMLAEFPCTSYFADVSISKSRHCSQLQYVTWTCRYICMCVQHVWNLCTSVQVFFLLILLGHYFCKACLHIFVYHTCTYLYIHQRYTRVWVDKERLYKRKNVKARVTLSCASLSLTLATSNLS